MAQPKIRPPPVCAEVGIVRLDVEIPIDEHQIFVAEIVWKFHERRKMNARRIAWAHPKDFAFEVRRSHVLLLQLAVS